MLNGFLILAGGLTVFGAGAFFGGGVRQALDAIAERDDFESAEVANQAAAMASIWPPASTSDAADLYISRLEAAERAADALSRGASSVRAALLIAWSVCRDYRRAIGCTPPLNLILGSTLLFDVKREADA
jgi:hypothetical protein